KVRQATDGKEPGGAALHQGGDPRRPLHERAAGSRLSQRQERCAQVQRQGKQPAGGHEAVPGRQELPPGIRPLQAQEAGGALELASDASRSSPVGQQLVKAGNALGYEPGSRVLILPLTSAMFEAFLQRDVTGLLRLRWAADTG